MSSLQQLCRQSCFSIQELFQPVLLGWDQNDVHCALLLCPGGSSLGLVCAAPAQHSCPVKTAPASIRLGQPPVSCSDYCTISGGNREGPSYHPGNSYEKGWRIFPVMTNYFFMVSTGQLHDDWQPSPCLSDEVLVVMCRYRSTNSRRLALCVVIDL